MKYLLPFFNKKDKINESIEEINEHFEEVYDAEKLQKIYTIICKDLFESPVDLVCKRLGGGGSGDILEVTGKNEMVKLTKDKAEAYNAQYLKNLGDKVTRFSKYFTIKKLEFEDPANDKKVKKEMYALKMERLNPVTGEDQKIAEKLIGWFNCKDMDGNQINKLYNFNNQNFKEFSDNNTEERLKGSFGKENNYERIRQFYLAFVSVMEEAIKHKIVLSDADSGNVAFNSSKKMVIFDLGGMGKLAISDENVASQIETIKIPALSTSEQPATKTEPAPTAV